MARAITLHLEHVASTPTDGLCPECWLPSVIEHRFALLGEHSIHAITIRMCDDCRHRIT